MICLWVDVDEEITDWWLVFTRIYSILRGENFSTWLSQLVTSNLGTKNYYHRREWVINGEKKNKI